MGAPQTVSGCAEFQSLYESESCCSSSSALSKQFVLFERPSSLCEVGWRSVTLGGVERCLKLHGTAVWTKAEANAACATEGGELVMPKTASDDAEVLGWPGWAEDEEELPDSKLPVMGGGCGRQFGSCGGGGGGCSILLGYEE